MTWFEVIAVSACAVIAFAFLCLLVVLAVGGSC